jgi:hypothetical protein
VFSGDAWYFGQAEFVRDGAGAIAGCKVSSGRVRNVCFQKRTHQKTLSIAAPEAKIRHIQCSPMKIKNKILILVG